MSLKSKISEAEERLEELIASVRIQEGLLEQGAERLIARNNEFNELDKEYKKLALEKERLSKEVATLAENINLFS